MPSRVRYDVGIVLVYFSCGHGVGTASKALFLFETQYIRDYVICFRLGKDEVRHILVIGTEEYFQRKPGGRR